MFETAENWIDFDFAFLTYLKATSVTRAKQGK
ncbi:MAG: hypothetical protein ACI9HY_000104 [Planctomycetaceae bacterium]|jgi:hypothetical protein